MQRIIETEYGDAIVEFVQYDEDGKIINEVTEVFLPEFLHYTFNRMALSAFTAQLVVLRAHIIESFHNGEGYNL